MLTKTSILNIIFIGATLTGNPVLSDPQSNTNAAPVNSDQLSAEINNTKTSVTDEATTATAPDTAPEIARSQFTTAIVDREPTDDVVMLTNNSEQIYFFTELANLKDRRITHRWEYQGKVMAEVEFDVKSDRWRVYSSKKINPDWTGEWSVVLIDENGNTLDTSKLNVIEATSTSHPTSNSN